MGTLSKKFLLVLAFLVGLASSPISGITAKAAAKDKVLRPNSIIGLVSTAYSEKILTVDIGGREGNKVTLWDRTLSGNSYVSQQQWKIEYDGTRGENVILIRSQYDNSVLSWDLYGTRSIISQQYNNTDRQYWIVESIDDYTFYLRSYYNPNYVLTIPSAPYYNGSEITVYPHKGHKDQMFTAAIL